MQLSIGQKAARTKTITAEDVRTFASLTGDYNPLHFDEAFAVKTKFGALVVQGGLTTGLLHALVATDLPSWGLGAGDGGFAASYPRSPGNAVSAVAQRFSVANGAADAAP